MLCYKKIDLIKKGPFTDHLYDATIESSIYQFKFKLIETDNVLRVVEISILRVISCSGKLATLKADVLQAQNV